MKIPTKKVMIFGTFDGLHDGHRSLVKQAQERGSVVAVVGVSSNVRMIKNRLPLFSTEERMHALAIEFPDISVIAGSTKDFLTPLREEKPDLLLLGYDQILPPGVTIADLQCPWERAEALQPHINKSSLLAKKRPEAV